MSIELKQVAEQSLDLSTPTLREMVTRHAAVIDSRATLEDMPEALAFQIDMARALLREFTAIQQAEAQQPATPEPVDFPAGAIVNGRTLMDRIEAYPFESEGGDLRMCSDWHELRRCFEHLADYVSPRPAPSAPKDDQIAALVNKVRDIARVFHDHQSLRERITIELVPALKTSQEVKSDAERYRWLRDNWFTMGASYPEDTVKFHLGNARWSEQPESNLDAAIDAAMLAAKEGGAA